MKIAEFVSAELPYPLPKGEVFAPIDVVWQLAESFVKSGHDVTWYAPKGTSTSAKIKDFGIEPVRLKKFWQEKNDAGRAIQSIFYDTVMLSRLTQESDQYDVIHLHSTRVSLPFCRLMTRPVVITLHNPFDSEFAVEQTLLHSDLKNVHYVSISDNQRQNNPSINYAKTIYHGLNLDQHPWTEKGGDRWLFVGRIVPNKGAHTAIEIIKKAGAKLDIIGPTYDDDKNQNYFETQIKPHVDNNNIRYLGPMSKEELYSYYFPAARGFIFPLEWDEPFGLTVIESLAAGTPVVTFPKGSMSELIENGKTGYLSRSVEEAVIAVKNIDQISRSYCRYVVEQRFSINRVVEDYLETFSRLAK